MTGKAKLPGSLYTRNGRYWWKVVLPGQDKPKAVPLKPNGCKFATPDRKVAEECARQIWQKTVFACQTKPHRDHYDGTLASLAVLYMDFVRQYYRKSSGLPTSEPVSIHYAIQYAVELYPTLPVEEFGPLKLKLLQEKMIENNLCRNEINRRIKKIRRMFKWAVSEELVHESVYSGLQTVEGLKKNRSKARETLPVRPVEETYVYAVLPYTTPVIADMIQIQLLTGMRSCELTSMRPCDIDTGQDIWYYRVPDEFNKNSYNEYDRLVAIGPKTQQLLKPYLNRMVTQYCFSPAESEQQRRDIQHQKRVTPLSCGNKPGTNRKENPDHILGDRYDTDSYRKAVQYAIQAANRDRKKQAAAQGQKTALIPRWTPHQLRHNTATRIRRELGLDAARATLGHHSPEVTAIYAELDKRLADEAARRFG